MPELPEVQTVVNDLNKKVLGKVIVDVWTDSPKLVRDHRYPSKRINGLAFTSSVLIEHTSMVWNASWFSGPSIVTSQKSPANDATMISVYIPAAAIEAR